MKKTLLAILILYPGSFLFSQDKVSDTMSMIADLNRVMSFAIQPRVHYTSVIQTSSEPFLGSEDTSTLHGAFYKTGNDLYYGTEDQEYYLQDSLLYQVSNKAKRVRVNMVDVKTKQRMDLLPLNSKMLRGDFLSRYTMSRSIGAGNIVTLRFYPKQKSDNAQTIISLEYNSETFLPRSMLIEVSTNEPVDDAFIETLQSEKIDVAKVIQTVNGVQYLVRSQNVKINFLNIETGKDAAWVLPAFKPERYIDYEITKLY